MLGIAIVVAAIFFARAQEDEPATETLRAEARTNADTFADELGVSERVRGCLVTELVQGGSAETEAGRRRIGRIAARRCMSRGLPLLSDSVTREQAAAWMQFVKPAFREYADAPPAQADCYFETVSSLPLDDFVQFWNERSGSVARAVRNSCQG